MEQEKEGLSLGDIFKIIMSQKWLALIITAAITFAGTLGLYFCYNPVVTYYVSTFSVSFPGGEGLNPVFPDNSPFDYRDIISHFNLVEAKAANEKFGYLDTGTMYEERDISIVRSGTEVVAEEIEITYTVSVKAKYFNSRSDAADFIDELVQMPVKYLLGIAEEQDAYLPAYNASPFYEDKVEVLNSQVHYLISGQQGLVERTNSPSNIQLLSELTRFQIKLKAAIGKLRENLYVHDVDEVKTAYSRQLKVMESELGRKKREADILFGRINSGDSSVDIIQSYERVEELAFEISILEEQQAIYSSYINAINRGGYSPGDSQQFADELSSLYTELCALTLKYEQSLASYFVNYSYVAYDGALRQDGNMHLLVCLFISFVAGAVAAAIVAYIVGYKKKVI